MRGAAVLAIVSALVACDDEPTRPKRPTGSAPSGLAASASTAKAPPLDAGLATDPPPTGGDLAADIERFTTLDACVASRAIGDAVLGDALLALGYDTFIRDACRVLAAGKERSPTPCRDITVSTLRRHCETVVATLAKDPNICPDEGIGRGREGTCLAFASRDARLCAAESEPRRTRCEAMVSNSAKRCASDKQSRAACERDVARWAGIFGDAPPPKSLPSPVATYWVGKADAGAEASPPSAIGSPSAASTGSDRGTLLSLTSGALVLEEKGTGVRRIDIASGTETASLFPTTAFVRLSVEVPPVPDGGALPKVGRVLRAEMGVPRGPQLTAPPATNDLVVRWKKLELERGGAIELEIEGTVGEADQLLRTKVEVKTFVRDFATVLPPRPDLKPALKDPWAKPGKTGAPKHL